MGRLVFFLVFSSILSQFSGITQALADGVYLCRSPLLAYDFWNSLLSLEQQGVTITPTIAEQICNGMRAGHAPQCIRVVAAHFKPFASGWNGSLAMTDGNTRIWFHEPDGFGWIDSRYYINLLNAEQN